MGFLRNYLSEFGARRLRERGLRLDDLIHDQHPLLSRALALIPHEEYVARQRRLLRAVDMSQKHTLLPKDVQQAQLTNVRYISPLILDLEAREFERETYDL